MKPLVDPDTCEHSWGPAPLYVCRHCDTPFETWDQRRALRAGEPAPPALAPHYPSSKEREEQRLRAKLRPRGMLPPRQP